MSEKIYLEGSGYVSVKDAAGKFSFTPDYIGRLCRLGKIQGRRIGKIWYVEEVSLAYFVKTEREKKTGRRQRLIDEYAHSRNILTLNSAEEKPVPTLVYNPPMTSRPTIEDAKTDFFSAKDLMRGAVTTMSRRRIFPNTTLEKPRSEFLQKITALTFALCLTFGTAMLCIPSADALAKTIAENSAASARDVLHSDPRTTAFLLDKTFSAATYTADDLALGLGNKEISGITQVGNAFSGYSNSRDAGVAQVEQSITTQEIETQKLCVGSTCVTQQQFLALVAAADHPASSTEATSTMP